MLVYWSRRLGTLVAGIFGARGADSAIRANSGDSPGSGGARGLGFRV